MPYVANITKRRFMGSGMGSGISPGIMSGMVGSGGGSPTFPRVVPMVLVHPEIGLRWDIPSDSSRIVMCMAFNGSYGDQSTGASGAPSNVNIVNKQPFGNMQAFSGSSAELTAGFDTVWDSSSGHIGVLRVNANNAAANPSANASLNPPTTTNSTTQQLLIVGDTNYGAGLKRLAVLINGVPVITGWPDQIGTAAFNMNLSQQLGFIINQLVQTSILGAFFQVGDFWCHTVSADIPATSINASNVVDPTLLAAFWANGSPQDTDKTKPLGLTNAQVQIFHKGPKGTFLTNQGTLTQRTQTVGNTLEQGVYDAPLNFGETASFPYPSWTTPSFDSAPNIVYTVMPYTGISNYGNPIALGDLLVICVRANPELSTGTNFNFGLSGSSGTAWQDVPNCRLNNNANGNTRALNMVLMYKIAEAADVTAAGSTWTNAPNLTWTTGIVGETFSPGAGADCSYTMMAFKNVNQSAPFFSSNSQNIAAGTNCSPPPLATPAANSLGVFFFGIYHWDDPTNNMFGTPNNAGQNLIFKQKTNGGNNAAAQFLISGTISNGSGGAGVILNVTATAGFIGAQQVISGGGATTCTVMAQISGTAGGTGNYLVSVSQNTTLTNSTVTPPANFSGCEPLISWERYTTNAGTGTRTIRQTNGTTIRNSTGMAFVLSAP